jgi:hypothetical protein
MQAQNADPRHQDTVEDMMQTLRPNPVVTFQLWLTSPSATSCPHLGPGMLSLESKWKIRKRVEEKRPCREVGSRRRQKDRWEKAMLVGL